MNTKQLKKIITYLNQNISHIKKLSIENYSEKSFIYITTYNSILNIIVSDKIVIEVDENISKHFTNFYNDRFKVDSVDEFKSFFNTIINKYKEQTKGLYITYKNKKYLSDIEIVSIDPDRGMGVEKLYDINIVDKNGEEKVAAQVSEYPSGSFSLVYIFDDFEITEQEIINYFYDNYAH